MRVPVRCARDEQGAMALFVALLTFVLLGFTAFVADFGMAYAQRQALASGVDSAALDVAHDLRRGLLLWPTSCAGLDTPDNESEAHATAVQRVNDNAPFGQDISDDQVETELTCVGADGNVLQVDVSVEHGVDSVLGNLFGVSEIEVSREAEASLGVANAVTGLRPIGVCKAQADQIIENARLDLAAGLPHRAERIRVDKVWPAPSQCSAGGGAGNWGWFAFPGQNNNSQDALRDIIANGYSGKLELTADTITIGGTPGNRLRAAAQGGMSAIMDDVVTLPVYDNVTGSGTNVTYTVVGFLTVRMCGYGLLQRGACYDASNADMALSVDDLQVRFVGHNPIGTIDDWCALDDPCAYNSYIAGLTH